LDNFIKVMLDPKFYIYLTKTLKFSAMTIGLAFFTPILLALFLSEVPRLKIFFRTLYFLPQISSSIVIMLLWRQMYSPSPTGLFNQLGMKLTEIPHPVAIAIKVILALIVVAILIFPFTIAMNAEVANR